MKKRITLILSAAAFYCIPAFGQVANLNDKAEIDSLEGFQADLALKHTGEAHDAAEANNQLNLAKRDYIDQKFALGRYAPGYAESVITQKNPVFPVSSCNNVDFETGDFTGWAGAIGDNMTSSLGPLDNIVNGIVSTTVNAPLTDGLARHTIVTNAFGLDPMGNFPVIPPVGGGTYAARLGGQTPNYQGEILEQNITVSPSSTQFSYQYAVVLNSGGHPDYQQPYFKIEVLDPQGQPISPCTQLYVAAGTNSANDGFFASPSDPMTYYKPWTTVNFDLTAYIAQNVTIRFTVAGCTQSGHYGYAYIDCSCSQLAASVHFCPGNTNLFLTAPTGYSGYQWLDPNHTPINGATNDTLIVNNPTVGDTFFVYLTSALDTSCHNTLPVVLQYTPVYPNAAATDVGCWGYTNGTLTASGSNGSPPYTYLWNTVPPQTSANVNNVGAGTYIVQLRDSLGCADYDTVTVHEPARLDTSDIMYAFCPGDPTIYLSAPAGYTNYTWIGPNGDTIPNGVPSNVISVNWPTLGSEYSVVLWSPPACPVYDSIILNLNPPSNFFNPDSTVNVFTPNGDLKNDVFYPYYDYSVSRQAAVAGQPAYDFVSLYIATYEIHIYDRWGNEVFYSNDYNFGWDGTVKNGKKCTEGVYYWVCTMTSRCKVDQTPIVSKGFVHLLRGDTN